MKLLKINIVKKQPFVFGKRTFFLIFTGVASIIYGISNLTLIPYYRLQSLELEGAIDYFPEQYAFLINGLVVLGLAGGYQYRGWKDYYEKADDQNIVMFAYPRVRQALLLPLGLIMATVSQQLLPFLDETIVFVGFVFSLIATLFLAVSTFYSRPEAVHPYLYTYETKFTVQGLVVWAGLWEFCVFWFWFIEILNIYLPDNAWDVANSESPSPSPTLYHQKGQVQLAGIAFLLTDLLYAAVVEGLSRTWFCGLAPITFFIFVSANNNLSAYTAITMLGLMVILQVLFILLDYYIFTPNLKKLKPEGAVSADCCNAGYEKGA